MKTHPTFEALCRERWGWTRARAYQQMDAAAVAGALSTTVDKPTTEREARAILVNLDPEERAEVRSGWRNWSGRRRESGKRTPIPKACRPLLLTRTAVPQSATNPATPVASSVTRSA